MLLAWDIRSIHHVPGTILWASQPLTNLMATTTLWGQVLLSPFYRWGNWGRKGSHNLPKVTQLVRGRAGFIDQQPDPQLIFLPFPIKLLPLSVWKLQRPQPPSFPHPPTPILNHSDKWLNWVNSSPSSSPGSPVYQLCDLRQVLALLCFHFLTCRMGLISVHTSQGYRGINEMIHVKFTELWLAHSKCTTHACCCYSPSRVGKES